MDDALISLLAASIAFVGTHFALSHPLRAPLVGILGATGFMAVYSLIAAGCMAWMYFAFVAAPAGGLATSGEVGWIVATVLTLPALVLFLGSLKGNPALPAPGAEKLATQSPAGVFAVTRHPMMWGFALWALSHILLLWSWRTMIVAGAILVLALVGAHMQDRKKEALMGAAWKEWEAKTSYWPRWGNIFGAGLILWAIAIAAWIGISYWHMSAAGIPAGVFRWLG
ncbi:NnrU family protein [Erythrobacter sp.]|uniref:NnrU family protein n=1 Tax=Erythrobacter sp. TaxID=1042 RepID=UPI001B0E8792|nr:NnrU family protein [Erythrobacter sp.]MBO6527706.1 MFS transporter [Erythrobacter sp.]MBO6530039.1 MFS transporter [Erythrobacter sp.]